MKGIKKQQQLTFKQYRKRMKAIDKAKDETAKNLQRI